MLWLVFQEELESRRANYNNQSWWTTVDDDDGINPLDSLTWVF